MRRCTYHHCIILDVNTQANEVATVLRAAVDEALAVYGLANCTKVLDDPRVSGPLAAKLPQAALAAVAALRATGGPVIHLSGAFDATCGIPTPETSIPAPADPAVVRGALAGALLNALLEQETVSYGSENDGLPFVNLVTLSGTGRRARKSKSPMRGHTDGVCFPFPGTRDSVVQRMAPAPDWVGLICLRNPHDVATRVVPMQNLIDSLPPQQLAALRSPEFVIQAQGSFVEGMRRTLGESHIVDGGALLHGEGAAWELRFSHSNVTVAPEGSEDASSALLAVEEYCANNGEPVVLKPGDLLWVNNRQAVHGRSEVGVTLGGNERWLLRTYGVRTSLVLGDQRYTERPFQLFP